MIFTKKDKRTNLEKEIDRVLEQMSIQAPDSEEYSTMRRNLEVLCEAKMKSKADKVKPDTIAYVVANLLGIVLILGYEETNVIRSKALGFIVKGRV